MKKTPRKLVLRSETLRSLANIDLARAIGAAVSGQFAFDSGPVACEGPAFDSGPVACSTDAVIIATTACR
jgi:hypothetical protein